LLLMRARTIAVDWSGALRNEQRALALAETVEGRVVDVAPCSRLEVASRLLALSDDDVIVGLDFAFSFPSWFLDASGVDDPLPLWRDTARLEGWLAACEPPFWGRPGCRRPVVAGDEFRRAERALAELGRRPSSVFQVGGAGSVGTGSLRGMPLLARLVDAGWNVWPFTADGGSAPTAVECWPRLAAPHVVKSRSDARAAHVATIDPSVLPEPWRTLAINNEHAFDAVVAALGLIHEQTTPFVTDPEIRREGWVIGVALPSAA
jgi:hypothetical protein